MNRLSRYFIAAALSAAVAGCGHWATVSVNPPAQAEGQAAAAVKQLPPTDPQKVAVFDSDVSGRPYEALADITVTINKANMGERDPTRQMVNQRLKEEAAKLGGEAVIFVRYGTTGMTALSYGSLEGRGRVVAFKDKPAS